MKTRGRWRFVVSTLLLIVGCSSCGSQTTSDHAQKSASQQSATPSPSISIKINAGKPHPAGMPNLALQDNGAPVKCSEWRRLGEHRQVGITRAALAGVRASPIDDTTTSAAKRRISQACAAMPSQVVYEVALTVARFAKEGSR